MTTAIRLGDLLSNKGFVTGEQIDEALRIQIGGNRRIGHILTKMGIISEQQLLETLSEQLEQPVIDIDKEFSPEVKKALPKYLCRKYSVMPISYDKNNVMNLAMLDPSDENAIKDVEDYTGKVVRPLLASGKDINHAISKYVTLTSKDLVNMRISGRLLQGLMVALLILLSIAGYGTYRYIQLEKYGTVTAAEETTIYKNHDLILGVSKKGGFSLVGHGEYSDGLFSVTFPNDGALKSFLEKKKSILSEDQYLWIQWVIKQSGSKE